jgi:hypothetical protein
MVLISSMVVDLTLIFVISDRILHKNQREGCDLWKEVDRNGITDPRKAIGEGRRNPRQSYSNGNSL